MAAARRMQRDECSRGKMQRMLPSSSHVPGPHPIIIIITMHGVCLRSCSDNSYSCLVHRCRFFSLGERRRVGRRERMDWDPRRHRPRESPLGTNKALAGAPPENPLLAAAKGRFKARERERKTRGSRAHISLKWRLFRLPPPPPP